MQKRKNFENKNATDCLTKLYQLMLLAVAWKDSVHSNLLTGLDLRVSVLKVYCRAVDCPCRLIFQPLPASNNSTQGGRHSLGKYKVGFDQINLL